MGIEVGGVFGLLILIGDIWAIISTLASSSGTGAKVIWILVILLLPLLGFILWLIFGPRAENKSA